MTLQDGRTDKGFELETLSYEEIFNAFKDVVNKIKKERHDGDFRFWPAELRVDRCEWHMAFGKDKNIYPKIRLDMGKYVLIVSTFEVKLLIIEYGVEEMKSEELDNVLIGMMCEYFPGRDYLLKREKYFDDAKLMERTQWNNLFY